MLAKLGVDLPLLVGFFVACFLSWVGDSIIQGAYKGLFRWTVEQNQGITIEEARRRVDQACEKFGFKMGATVGRLERVLYIYAFMLGQFGLVSAWVVLKAFFGWINRPAVSSLIDDQEEGKLITFYLYIYGNGLSLLLAMGLAHLGKVVGAVVSGFLTM